MDEADLNNFESSAASTSISDGHSLGMSDENPSKHLISGKIASTFARSAAINEEDFANLFDKCVADVAIKVGTGTLIGGLSSLLLFKRRIFPIWFGTGFGMGAAFMACQNNLKEATKSIDHYEKDI